MKKIVLSTLCAIALSACGGTDPMADSVNKFGEPITESGFYESSSSVIGQKFLASVEDTILFGYDSFKLTPEAMEILNQQADFIKDNPGVQIVIEGHTDERGTREYNLALGEKRAVVVSTYLKSQGVENKNIKIISFGKERPVVEMHDAESWSKNRRSVTVIM